MDRAEQGQLVSALLTSVGAAQRSRARINPRLHHFTCGAAGTCGQDQATCLLPVLAGFQEQASSEAQAEAVLPFMTPPWGSHGIISVIFLVLPRCKAGEDKDSNSRRRRIRIAFEEGHRGHGMYIGVALAG